MAISRRVRRDRREPVVATALIADKDRAFRSIVRRAIEGCVYVAGEAENVGEAISLARRIEADVILIDLDLPGGGIETAWRIKAERPGIRVILMTGHGEEAYLEATGRAGTDAFLPKRNARTRAPAIVRSVLGSELHPWVGGERGGRTPPRKI